MPKLFFWFVTDALRVGTRMLPSGDTKTGRLSCQARLLGLRELASYSSFNPLPLRMCCRYFSILDTLVADCFALEK